MTRPRLLAATAALLLTCACNPFAPSAETLSHYPVRGIDVSHHQGAIDWPAVARSDIRFAFIKATEGATHRDSFFARNWAQAHAAGIPRGAYHYFTFCAPGAEQARNFRNAVPIDPHAVPIDPHALPPAVDVEFIGNCQSWTSIDTIRHELRIFIAAIKGAYATDPILYVTEDSYQRILAGALHVKRLWVRDTWHEPSKSALPDWLLWQHAGDGHVQGIRGPVDLNVFRGSAAELKSLR